MTQVQLFLIPAMYFLCFSLMGYHLLAGLREAITGEGDAVSRQASRELESLFLFIPAHRISSLSQSAAILAFVTGFLVFGNLRTPAGLLGGLVAGLFLFSLIRMIPGVVIRMLKKKAAGKVQFAADGGLGNDEQRVARRLQYSTGL